MKIAAFLLELGQTRVFLTPISLKITEKREKREWEQEREKMTSNSLKFLVWTLKKVFERKK